MSNELKEIELETARLKLERERLALGKELRSQQRIEDAKSAVTNIAGAVASSESKRAFKAVGKVVLWIAVIYIAATIIKFSLRF